MCTRNRRLLTVRELALFAVLGALMFVSKVLMDALPNIHLIGALTMTYTVAFRYKALFPLAVFVILAGVYGGFSLWWIPYLYIWAVLWGATMLLPRRMSRRAARFVYPGVCCLHGLLYGTLYAPAQALMFGMGWKATVSWVVAGLPWDALHGAGNLVAGLLILPLSDVLKKIAAGKQQ